MSQSQRIELVAKLLGYSTTEPSKWPMQMIEQLLFYANDAAERRLAEEVQRINDAAGRKL